MLDAGAAPVGRIELARRGLDVVGVDLDESMLAEARRKTPDLNWVTGDLVDVDLGRRFDVVVMAGNVMIFVTPGTEDSGRRQHGTPRRSGRGAGRRVPTTTDYTIDRYDADCVTAGLRLEQRYSTWRAMPGRPAAPTPSAFTALVLNVATVS